MHGVTISFIVNAQQAKLNNIYKNTKLKLLKTNAAIWFSKMCLYVLSLVDKLKLRTHFIRILSHCSYITNKL